MSAATDRLYELLPAIYRLRDAEQRGPLLGLLQVIAEQVELVEEDIDQLYANWFVETCQDWVVPYIGDLVGYHPAQSPDDADQATSPRGQRREAFLFPRRAVANAVRDRRRKGTLALLESLATDFAGWPARAVEFYRLLGVAQPVHLLGTSEVVPRIWRRWGRTAALWLGDVLDRRDGPFDELAHTVDVRRVGSRRTQGRYDIPSVGLFVWRLGAYPVTRTPALCLEDQDPHRYTFSILGNDTPLFTRPRRELVPTHIAGELNVPTPIRRRAFQRREAAYYGTGTSLEILIGEPPALVPPERIIPANLDRWRYRPRPGDVAVDPELGRILFSHRLLGATRQGVRVSYLYGFSADIGGGEYERPLSARPGSIVQRVSGNRELRRRLAPWIDEDRLDAQPPDAVIEITDSQVYDLPLGLKLRPGHRLQLRAANRRRPVIRLPDWRPGPDALRVSGEEGSAFTLDGLLVAGNAVQVDGDLAELAIRHCTLVPGWGLHADCEPRRPARPSLELIDTDARVTIEHSIVGSIEVLHDPVRRDPVRIRISDSIVDATAAEREALGALGGGIAHVVATFERVTVIGQIRTHAIDLADNSIFGGHVEVARRQLGCMRFCSIVPGSRTPRRYECQPDLVEARVDKLLPPSQERDRARRRERLRVRPAFNSLRYGTPAYCQLAATCASEITEGADDEAEMGAFHDLYQPQRAAALRAALEEFTPAGMDVGIIDAS
jgi:hypothetical protein